MTVDNQDEVENNQDNPSMEDIITLAQSNTWEGWEKIDSVLPQISFGKKYFPKNS